jgi:hypothetical protein
VIIAGGQINMFAGHERKLGRCELTCRGQYSGLKCNFATSTARPRVQSL